MLPERRNLSQAITEAVITRIRSGEFRPGDKLPTEKGLMEQYNVGRNAAREAVQALVAMGLVDVRPGRGAVLIGVEPENAVERSGLTALLTDQAIDDLFDFRRLLEIEIARTAAIRATDADVEELTRTVRRFDEAADAGRSVSDIDDELHEKLAAASQNAVYATMLVALIELIANARQVATRVPWALTRAQEEHRELLDAIRQHDPDAAVAAMTRHLDNALEAIHEGRAQLAEEASSGTAA